MAITAYCKKCHQDVPLGDLCPRCGGKLPRSSARVAWCIRHTPVEDWMCWNAIARILLPAYAVVLGLIVLLEALQGGAEAVQRLLFGGFLLSMALLLVFTVFVALLLLHLQGDDLLDCVVDSRGVHVQQYLLHPTPLRLLLRFRSPALMAQTDNSGGTPTLLIAQRELSWKDIARVQLWPEKNLVLFYAPQWWMRLALYCTPFTWPDVMTYMRDKVGRKKNLLLPRELVAPPKPRAAKAVKKTETMPAEAMPAPEEAPVQVPLPPQADAASASGGSGDELSENATDMAADAAAPEQTADFVPLADVLKELQEQENEKP